MAGTRKAKVFPDRIQPQLVTFRTHPPADDDAWDYEPKHDGFRLLVRIDSGVKLFTKNGLDWTAKMPRLQADLARLPVRGTWIDGEIVALDDEGISHLHLVQQAFREDTSRLIYYAFDLLFFDQVDLRSRPVQDRRALLRALLEGIDLDSVRYSASIEAHVPSLFASACAAGLEGLIGKRRGSTYTGDRDGSWIKLKCKQRQEFVIVGYTRSRGGVGSILIGYHDGTGALVYAGRVRSGFTDCQLDELQLRLQPIERDDSSLANPPLLKSRVVWVDPMLLAEVRYQALTQRGKVRDAVYMGLRDDKVARGITIEG